MNQLTNLPSSLAEPEAAPSQRPLGPEKCSNVPPLAAQTHDNASLSPADELPFVTAQDAPALATVTGADVPVLVTNPPSLTAGGAVEAAAAPGAGAVASNAPTHSEVCCSRESGGEAKGAKRSRTPEYKSQQSEAAKRRRKENAERAKKDKEELQRLRVLVQEQAAQIAALEPGSQQQRINAAEHARAKAERAALQAHATCALAQASSDRLTEELYMRRAETSAAARDVRRMMQEAGELRAALSRAAGAEKQVAVDDAVARALHSTELEQRRVHVAHSEELDSMRASARGDRARANAAEARARDSDAAVVAANARAKLDRTKCRALESEARRHVHAVTTAARVAAEDATSRAFAMLGDSSNGSDSEGGPSGRGGGGGGGGNDGCGGSSSSKCPDYCAWRSDGGQLTAPVAGRKRVSAQRGPRTLRTDGEKVRGMQAATSGASYAEIMTLSKLSSELGRISDKRNLQRAASDARIVGLLLHGIELCSAIQRVSIKADGFSMHDKSGLREFLTYTHTLKDAHGKLLELPIDGFLMSQGLTAEDEARLCDRSLCILKVVVAKLRQTYCEMFGNECCPRWLSEDRVNLASFSHVGADGANAAQKWARLMKGRIQDATKAHIGTNHWNQLSAIEQARELHVLVTNCCIHGGVLGFSWGSKAGAKLTAELGAAAVASVRDTGRASDHFSHACNLKQALHCGGKLLGCSNGYAYGKAFYFLTVFLRPHFAHIEYIAWPRQNGSRFFGMIRMCAVFLRTREVALEALSNLMVGAGASLSKIVSSYWSQVNSPVLLMEARVSEAMMAALGEPTQVLLGQGAFGSGCADASAGWKSVLDSEVLELLGGGSDAADAVCADEDTADGGCEEAGGGGTAEGRVESLTASAAPFVNWHSGASDRSLAAYRAGVAQDVRTETAEAFRDASTTEVFAVLGGCNGGCDAALALIDGGEHAEPCAGKCGVWETVDVISGLIFAARAFAERPSLVFDGRRPSARLEPFLPAYATKKLEEWEAAVYKRPSKNAGGAIIGASSRAAADLWRKEPPELCAELEADGTRDRYAAAMFGACADEWEKYFANALGGDTASGGRVGWQGDKLAGAKFDTAFVESNNGAAKHVCQQMQGRGAHSRQVSRVLASQADMWGRWGALDEKMQAAILRSIPLLRKDVDEFTEQSKNLNARAEADRKERQQRAAVKAAAKTYAIAQALHSFELWTVPKLTAEMKALKFIYQKRNALEQQLAIIVTGYGFSDCAFAPKKGDSFCSFCGADLKTCSAIEHLEKHVKRAIKVASERGRPAAAPLPEVCIKQACFAPVLDKDQSNNPLFEVMSKLSEQAKAMAPKIAVAVAPVILGGTRAPAFDKKLVGMVIEYVFRICEAGARKKKSQLYTYQGYVESIEVVDEGKPNEHALAVCVWPTTLRDGVFVEEKERETCMLFKKYYGKQNPNGWAVYKGQLETDAASAEEVTVSESFENKMHERRIESDMLCVYS